MIVIIIIIPFGSGACLSGQSFTPRQRNRLKRFQGCKSPGKLAFSGLCRTTGWCHLGISEGSAGGNREWMGGTGSAGPSPLEEVWKDKVGGLIIIYDLICV